MTMLKHIIKLQQTVAQKQLKHNQEHSPQRNAQTYHLLNIEKTSREDQCVHTNMYVGVSKYSL